MSPIPASWGWPAAIGVPAFEFSQHTSFVIHPPTAGSLRRPSTSVVIPKASVGYGDADPSNVSDLVRGAEMRVAETRAVNRALRKAYGIGLCSVEEIGTFHRSVESFSSQQNTPANGDIPGNGQPRLRDRLCQLIRQHSLDPSLVKSFAADFCGTASLRKASRDQVESFINHLSEMAAKDRAGLVCQLNSYNSPQEVRS